MVNVWSFLVWRRDCFWPFNNGFCAIREDDARKFKHYPCKNIPENSLLAQFRFHRALSSYLFGIGGVGSVRAYPLSAYQGDHGYNASAEYTVPSPWKMLSLTSFVEHGQTYIRARRSGEVNQHITSAGGGLKLTIPKKGKRPAFRFAANYAIPVFKSIRPAGSSYGTVYLNGGIEY